ncbi:MAG: polyprenyl synthetase family protein [bacterium]|jgi:geranylgeranyl pyrophosphate synthase
MLSKIFAPVTPELKLVQKSIAATLEAVAITPKSKQVFSYPLASKGKQIRAALVLLAAMLPDENDRKNASIRKMAIKVAVAAELLHLATLLHDDVLDLAAQRRGKPTLHTLWGSKAAILTGDFFFARAYGLLVETENPDLLLTFTKAIANTCAGEIQEHLDAFSLQVAPEYYLDRIGNKSASFFAACAQAGGVIAAREDPYPAALSRYGYNLGMAYQLMDDILDLIGDPVAMGKPIGQDIRQGVYTLPTLIALEEKNTGPHLKKLLGKPLSQAEIEKVCSLLLRSQGIQSAYKVALEYKERALRELELLPPSPVKDSLINLAGFVVNHKKIVANI